MSRPKFMTTTEDQIYRKYEHITAVLRDVRGDAERIDTLGFESAADDILHTLTAVRKVVDKRFTEFKTEINDTQKQHQMELEFHEET